MPDPDEIAARIDALTHREKMARISANKADQDARRIALESKLETARWLVVIVDHHKYEPAQFLEFARARGINNKTDAYGLLFVGAHAEAEWNKCEAEAQRNPKYKWPSWGQIHDRLRRTGNGPPDAEPVDRTPEPERAQAQPLRFTPPEPEAVADRTPEPDAAPDATMAMEQERDYWRNIVMQAAEDEYVLSDIALDVALVTVGRIGTEFEHDGKPDEIVSKAEQWFDLPNFEGDNEDDERERARTIRAAFFLLVCRGYQQAEADDAWPARHKPVAWWLEHARDDAATILAALDEESE